MAQRQRGADIAHAEPLDAMLSHQEPLDENEQYRIIREFEDMQLSQTRTFRTIFGAGAALIAAFFLYAANEQAARPWEVRYTGELRTVVTSSGVVGAFLIQATALAAAAVGLLLRLPRPGERERGCLPVAGAARGALAAGALGAAAGAAYWCAALRRSIAKYGPEDGAHWDLLWLPLAPLAFVALCWFVMHSVASTGKEIEKLRKMTYNYKAV